MTKLLKEKRGKERFSEDFEALWRRPILTITITEDTLNGYMVTAVTVTSGFGN